MRQWRYIISGAKQLADLYREDTLSDCLTLLHKMSEEAYKVVSRGYTTFDVLGREIWHTDEMAIDAFEEFMNLVEGDDELVVLSPKKFREYSQVSPKQYTLERLNEFYQLCDDYRCLITLD